MKKLKLLMIAGLVISLSACAQKMDPSKVPAKVKDAFSRQYPGIRATWEKEDGKYEAGFEKDQHEMSVLLDEQGTITATETAIAESALPNGVKDYIRSHYNGAAIKEAAMIVYPDGKTEWEAAIKKKDIIFDVKGVFLREVAD